MKLNLLSWNIWCDGHFDEIEKFLKASDADIIALQEVLPESKALPVIELLTSLGYAHAYAPSFKIALAAGGDGEIGNAVFSRYPITGTQTHVLSGEGEEEKRVALQVDIQLDEGVLHVFSVHLTHTHQQPSAKQSLQAENLIKALPKEKTVVVGDFNAVPNSAVITRMREVLTDTDSDSTPTWSVYPEGCSVCNPKGIDTRLDYIFASADIKTSSFKVGDSKGSDHLPISVLAEI